MAKLPGGFTTEGKKEMQERGNVLPKGDYVVKIIESDYVKNNKKTGHNVKLTREVIEGEFKGRKIFRNLAIDNPNSETVRIANEELTSTALAVGVPDFEDTEDLHDIPHVVSLYIKKGSKDTPDKNEIGKIAKMEGMKTPSAPKAGKSSDEPKPKKPSRPVFDDDDEEDEE